MNDPLIVIVTNRDVHPEHKDENLFGEKRNQGGWDQLRVATAKYSATSKKKSKWQLELIDDDGSVEPPPSKQLFDEIVKRIVKKEFSNRFVFFIHGNNQTFIKNLNKCRKLSKIHDVNVIAFSWPSRPDKSGPEKRYREAQKIAVQSAPALDDALTKLASYTEFCRIQVELNLLVHSLGNLLFKTFTESFPVDSSMNMFRRVILHQGSPANKNHHYWANQIEVSQESYLTINQKDKILRWAEKIDPPTIGKTRKNLVADETIYIDFTGGEHVDNKHQLFGIREGSVNETLRKLLVGIDPELDTHFEFHEKDNTWQVKKRYITDRPVGSKSWVDMELGDLNPDYDPEFDDPEDQTIQGAYPRLLE